MSQRSHLPIFFKSWDAFFFFKVKEVQEDLWIVHWQVRRTLLLKEEEGAIVTACENKESDS